MFEYVRTAVHAAASIEGCPDETARNCGESLPPRCRQRTYRDGGVVLGLVVDVAGLGWHAGVRFH